MDPRFHIAALGILACLFPHAVAGSSRQLPPPPPGPSSPAASASVPATSFVVEERRTSARFEADGTGHRETNLRVKVLDAQGVRAWTQISLNYASDSEQLTLTKLEVRKPGGHIVTVAADAVQDLAIQVAPQLPIFLDLRQKHATVPALEVGDTVVLSARWRITRALAPNYFWFDYTFEKDAVVLDERLEIDLPASVQMTLKVRPDAPQEEKAGKGSVDNDRRLYRWTTANAVVSKKESEESEEAGVPDVRLTSFQNWTELGQWIGGLMAAAPDAAVRAKATELTKGLTTPRDKIQAIYDYVATEIRYVSLSFGLGRFAPHAPAEVLKHQYGDCKDKHVLLASLLWAIEIQAFPVLINTGRNVSEDVPSPAEFDHVITVIPNGSEPAAWTWLDTTTEIAPFGMLVKALRGKRGFMAGDSGRGARLVLTPADPPFAMTDRIEIAGTVDDIGVLKAHVRFRARGDSEVAARAFVRAAPREALIEFAKGVASMMELEGDVSDVGSSDPIATREPFELTFRLRRRGYLDWAAESGTLDPVSTTLALAGFDDDKWTATKDVRTGTPSLVRLHSAITLPNGYTAQAPVGVSVSRGGIDYTSRYDVRGNRLTVERELKVSARTLPVSASAEYAALGRALAADQSQHFRIRSAVSGTPAIPSDATAAELYSAGYSAYKSKKDEAAIALWTRASELDPKMTAAWNALGLSFVRIGRYAEAIAALERQIALEPLDKRAYRDLGYVHKQARSLESAAKAYAKHTELNPLDGPAFRSLGEVYHDLERHAEAIAALEKASALGTNDDWLHVMLGGSYLDAKRTGDARRAFDRALEMSQRPAVWTRVAYELSVHGIDLERAAELATRTVTRAHEVTEALRLDAVTDTHIDLMERLAWAWSAQGLTHLKNGKADEAARYLRAAWRLDSQPVVASHLGRVYENGRQSSEALKFSLAAHALVEEPPAELRERVKRLAGGGDLEKRFEVARAEVLHDRSVQLLEGKQFPVKAEYLAIVQSGGRIVELKMLRGHTLAGMLEPLLRESVLPIETPDTVPARLVVGVNVICGPERGCVAVVVPPSETRISIK